VVCDSQEVGMPNAHQIPDQNNFAGVSKLSIYELNTLEVFSEKKE
jgi:hypothetical protein